MVSKYYRSLTIGPCDVISNHNRGFIMKYNELNINNTVMLHDIANSEYHEAVVLDVRNCEDVYLHSINSKRMWVININHTADWEITGSHQR